MNNQEILDNAPEGATHVDNCGFYLKAGKSGFMEPDNLSNDWDYEYSNHSEVSSLTDIKRIAELEQEVKGYQVALSMPANNEAQNLEQQAKWMDIVASHLNKTSIHGAVIKNSVETLADSYRRQAKTIKEQGE